MKPKQYDALSRRQFIRQAACAAVGTAAMTATIRDLRFMNAAMAQSNITDYKALVCLFLAGGNDSNNLVVPTSQPDYNNYSGIRTSLLALPVSGSPANQLLIPLSPLNSDGHSYALHPACVNLSNLFNQTTGGVTQGKLALMFNTGTLVYPMTRAQYFGNFVKKPPQLFSHADQVTQWQTSIPDQPPLTGWGGRCADLLAAVQPNAPISLTVTLSGANTFEVGNVVSQYSVSTSGAIALSGLNPTNNVARYNAVTNILGLNYSNLQAKAYSGVAAHTINTGVLLNGAIANTASYPWPVTFPGTITNPTSGTTFGSNLGPQLKMIARLIEAGNRSVANGGFGMKRQIFFCSVGGYDLHTNQAPSGSPTTGSHSNLLSEVDQCLWAFQRAMDALGLTNNVTVFTASDFSRTLQSNGQGSDHGWGSHHLLMGGAVHGQKTYGTFPTLQLNGPDDTGTGRWIPTTATDQYFSTLALWFGVDAGKIATVFPNIGRFSTSNVGFI